MITIYHTHFNRKAPLETFEDYLCRLTPERRKRIDKFRKWEDAYATMFGDLLLKEALEPFGLSLEEVKYSKFGKPFVNDQIRFNISHSGNVVVCAITDEQEIGVDIEEVHDIGIEDFKLFMRDEEWKAVRDDLDAFYRLWTQKEAVIKADGRGLSFPVKEIFIEGDEARLVNKKWQLLPLQLQDGYACHLACENKEVEVNVVEKNF